MQGILEERQYQLLIPMSEGIDATTNYRTDTPYKCKASPENN